MEENHQKLDSAFNAIIGKDNEARRAADSFLVGLPLKASLVDALLEYISNDMTFAP